MVFTLIVVATLASEVATGDSEVTPWQVATIAGTAIALLFRRRAPLTVLVVVTLLTSVVTFLAESNLVLAVPIALYAVAAFRSPVIGWVAAAAAYLVTVVSLFAWLPVLEDRLGAPSAFDIPVVLLTLAMADAVGVLLGTNTWQRAERVRALTERAEQLARERDNEARIATLAERSRIAREMHDIVAHSLSVMITLADGAGASLQRDPDRARLALDRLSETGRTALRDMRQLLSVLGDSTDAAPAREPAPGNSDLAGLVEQFRTAGLPVRFSVHGVPVADAALELVVYRVVQEALTNTLRYARDPQHVTVAVDYGPERRPSPSSTTATPTPRPPRSEPAAASSAWASAPRCSGAPSRRDRCRRAGGACAPSCRVRGTTGGRRDRTMPDATTGAGSDGPDEAAAGRGIRVLLVDDQPLIRLGFRMVLEGEPDLEVVGEAEDGDAAVALAVELAPDVVIMDVRMPGTDGIAATARIVERAPGVRVLIVTTFDLDEYAFAGLRAGASGFLLKNAPPAELVRAIRTVAAGDAIVEPRITRRLLDLFGDRLPGADDGTSSPRRRMLRRMPRPRRPPGPTCRATRAAFPASRRSPSARPRSSPRSRAG